MIQFTCPGCGSENTITCRMPKDFFRETRDAGCRKCRTRYTIVSPNSRMKVPSVLTG